LEKIVNERYQPDHIDEQNTCKYCHITPVIWQHEGHEKVCPHCGTRVYNSALTVQQPQVRKSA
jgi:transcription initiation factor TFIIIB Brf1 subunit/transcription initiation factor TFIIB